MLSDGSTKDDVKLPEGDLGDKIKAGFDDGKELRMFFHELKIESQ